MIADNNGVTSGWAMRANQPVVLVAMGLLLMVSSSRAVDAQARGTDVSSVAEARALLDQYCVRCHSDRLMTAGLSLEAVDLGAVGASAATLDKAVRKLRLGAMPPSGNPRPEPATYAALTSWLESELDRAAAARPNPGRTESLHRLNRSEYANVIRDLLHLEGLDYSILLPGDDASYGFDNIAGVLGMTATHLERYLAAARTISWTAVGDVTLPPSGETRMIPPDFSQDDRLAELPFGTRGGTLIRRYFPVDADYVIRFQAFTGVGESEAEPNFIELSIDGEQVFFEKMTQKPIKHTINGADIQANTDWEVRTPVKAGFRDVAVTFVKTTSGQLDHRRATSATAALALPLLDAMVPALTASTKTAANGVPRLGYIYVPNGMHMPLWKPETPGRNFKLSQILRAMEPVRDRLTVFGGLNNYQAGLGDGGGPHTRNQAAWLSGTAAVQGTPVLTTTVDQHAARVLGRDTLFESLEVCTDLSDQVGSCDNGYSCLYVNTLSWRSATVPNPMERNPRIIFERLFGEERFSI